ncbi:glycoside hydrolase family 88 protein [Jiulongibacter sp. NS-SX5]|uniref:glycoside hydrolase family 88 protein n=1 Tax=Jiulongibacter sp. NS-SX5 TaxID=3463854 RepID=UPI0040598617
MKYIISCILTTILFGGGNAQITSGLTGVRDHSYSNEVALASVQKEWPDAELGLSDFDKPLESVENLEYAKLGERALHLDLFKPYKNSKKTAVIFIHGGGWRTGDKSQHHELARELAGRGYLVITPEYRLSTEALYPAAISDVKASIAWLNQRKAEFGLENIAIAGFSAGGQLAAQAGVSSELTFGSEHNIEKEDLKVDAIIDIDGILSFTHPESGEGDDSKSISAATHYFGYAKGQHDELWESAGALNYVGAGDPPTLFINSREARMHAGREDYIDVLNKNNIYSEVHTFEGAPHSFPLIDQWFMPTVDLMDNFLQKVTNPSPMHYAKLMAKSFMTWHQDSIAVKTGRPANWNYEQGLALKAIEKVWRETADPSYFDYIVNDINRYVTADGNIRTYKKSDYNLDNISTGRLLMTLYHQSIDDREKYKKAADLLWSQLKGQPVTKEGGYWHKKRYPFQMWLDGLFMAEPFSAEYSKTFNHPEHFDHILKQFQLIEEYAVDEKTGLIYHGYDESREQRWANPETGLSPHFWGRAIGWYAMALVEVLDYFPEDHEGRDQLISYLQRLAPALLKYQDEETGVWYQMIALVGKEGNYLESSSSCMFAYSLLKGVRKGYLDESYRAAAIKAYEGILNEFIIHEQDGTISLDNTVSVGGLGGNPYRDGSYEYYLSEPIRLNDLKGVGPFIFTALEMAYLDQLSVGEGKKVFLDNYFNNELREGVNGKESFHYIWDDQMHSGFYWLGQIFENYGASKYTLKEPTAQNLTSADIYIIVDPDDAKETQDPNFITAAHSKVIKKWVKKGGHLLLMTNDAGHCELEGANKLIQSFGLSFTDKNINMVQGKQWEQGSVLISKDNPVFKNVDEVYIKELVTINPSSESTTLLKKGDDHIMVTVPYKKGHVTVIGDPWLYNEYVDGRRIPDRYQNFQAAKDLAKWLLTK